MAEEMPTGIKAEDFLEIKLNACSYYMWQGSRCGKNKKL